MYFKDPLVGVEPTPFRTDLINQRWWCVCVSRMHTHGEKFLSGVKKAATTPSLDFLQTFRASTGSSGSPSWPRTASSCLRVRRNWTRKTGWLLFRPLSTDPCCLRSMQVDPIFTYLLTPKTLLNLTFFFAHFFSCSGGVFQTQTMTVCRICRSNGEEGGIWSLHYHSPHHAMPPRGRPIQQWSKASC